MHATVSSLMSRTCLSVVVLVLAAAEGDEGPGDDDRHDAHDEGEDGGEEEDPPLALLVRQHRLLFLRASEREAITMGKLF